MADDSLEIQKDEVPFHPCLTPRGMYWYDFNVLTPLQQTLLNNFKVEVIAEDNKYLAKHPEIRAIIALFLRAILKEKPKLKTVADFAKDFFSRPQIILQTEIDEYMTERGEPLKKEGDSAINLEVESDSDKTSVDDATSFYRQGFYSYVSLTDVPSSVEECEDMGSAAEDIERLYDHASSEDQSSYYTSSTQVTISRSEYQRQQFDLLFASKATLFTQESVEASTIDMTRDYISSYFGEEEESLEMLDDDVSKQALEELELAAAIQGRLSIVLDNIDDAEEEDQEDYYEEYLEQLNKKTLLEMDLETLRERMSYEDENDFDEETGLKPSQKTSIILEKMLEYEEAGEVD